MMPTEINAERARAIAARFLELSAELSCDSHDWRCKVLGEFAWHSRFEIAAALEQLAAERERVLELEEKVAKHDQAKQSYTCPFCEEVYGPDKISLDALREAVALHAPTCADHPLTQRIATLEREMAAAKADAQRYRTLRAILRGDERVSEDRTAIAAYELDDLGQPLTGFTCEEIDAAVDVARAAQMTPDEEAEVRSRIEARTNAKEKS